MLTAIALDDETMALEVIKSHATKVPFLELREVFTDAVKAMEYLNHSPTDLMFLDIKMPDISGIEVASLIPEKTMVVFTTAYSEHAVRGFELSAIDYLLKPFSLARFLQACQKARKWQEMTQNESATQLFVKNGTDLVKIPFDQLGFCEAQGNYVTFHFPTHMETGRITLAEVEKQMPASFARTHRSFIVNLKHVDRLERHQLYCCGKTVPVSASFYEKVVDELRVAGLFGSG